MERAPGVTNTMMKIRMAKRHTTRPNRERHDVSRMPNKLGRFKVVHRRKVVDHMIEHELRGPTYPEWRVKLVNGRAVMRREYTRKEWFVFSPRRWYGPWYASLRRMMYRLR